VQPPNLRVNTDPSRAVFARSRRAGYAPRKDFPVLTNVARMQPQAKSGISRIQETRSRIALSSIQATHDQMNIALTR